MADYISKYSGKQIDEFTNSINNLKPSLEVIGVDPNTTVTILSATFSPPSSTSKTSDSSGKCIFTLPAISSKPCYGLWTITGTVNSVTKTVNVTVDKTKKYSVAMYDLVDILNASSVVALRSIVSTTSSGIGSSSCYIDISGYTTGTYYLFQTAKRTANYTLIQPPEALFSIWKIKNGVVQSQPIFQSEAFDTHNTLNQYFYSHGIVNSTSYSNRLYSYENTDANMFKTVSSVDINHTGKWACGFFLVSFSTYSEEVVDMMLSNIDVEVVNAYDASSRGSANINNSSLLNYDCLLVYTLYANMSSTTTTDDNSSLNFVSVDSEAQDPDYIFEQLGHPNADIWSFVNPTFSVSSGYGRGVVGIKSAF